MASEIAKASWPRSRKGWNAWLRITNREGDVWSWNMERLVTGPMKNVAMEDTGMRWSLQSAAERTHAVCMCMRANTHYM